MSRANVVSVPAAVAPAQPFSLFWVVCQDTGVVTVDPQTVRLSLNGVTVFPLAGDASEPGASPATAATSGIVVVDGARLAAVGLRPADLYRIGTRVPIGLRAQSELGVTSGSGELLIRGAVTAPSVRFTAPPVHAGAAALPGDVRDAHWKEPFNCALEITNHALTDLRISLSLRETEHGTGVASSPVDSHVTVLAPRETQAVTFSAITKSWDWLLPGLWIPTAPTTRNFDYDVAVAGTDEFGNPINAVLSTTITVAVAVSDDKIGLAVGAAAALVSALTLDGLSAIPVIGIGFAIGAAAAHVLSGGLGDAAEDPPSPDPSYQSPVPLIMPPALKKLDQLPSNALAAWLRAAGEFAVRRMRLYAIEAKVLGAIVGNDDAAEQARVREYAAELRELASLYREASAAVDPAIKDLRDRGATPEVLSNGLADLQAQALSGVWSKQALELDAAGVDLAPLVRALAAMKGDNPDLRATMKIVTVELGRAVQRATNDAVRRYAAIRPQHFGGKP